MAPTEILHQYFLSCSGVCTDTRTIRQGSLFFALRGANHDANAFASEAIAKGSRYAVVDDPSVVADDHFLLVNDSLRALQELGRYHRRRFRIPVLAITGSNGKTTTKELVHAVLGADRPTLATEGNLNNHIGVPLTLLRMDGAHRIAIIEMGANRPGDIAQLCGIAEPTHGLVTNIGKAHLEGFGGYDGVVRTKTELYTHIMERGGSLFVDQDNELLLGRSEGIPRVTYGTARSSDTVGEAIANDPFLTLVFKGRDGRPHRVGTRLIGAYNLPNALAAVAIGQHFGVPDERIATALAAYEPGNNRSQFMDTGRNQLVLDAYNANPTSMATALRNFAGMPGDRPKLAILGDMLELGAESRGEHDAIVTLVKDLGLDARFVGPEFHRSATRHAYPDSAALHQALKDSPLTRHLVLLKGSRGIKLETVVPAL